jgi:hypothetical protein
MLPALLAAMLGLEDLPPIVLDWLENSQDPRAIEWRAFIYAKAQENLDQAAKVQLEIKKEIDELPHQGRNIRRLGIIDPRYHADLQRQFEKRGGIGNWFADAEFLADTRKRNPHLFA